VDTKNPIPLISIIIPNFNGASTLRQCLRAATTLKDEHFEVIVVDDGSHDNSVEIIKEFPCRLIQLEQQCGASRARNVGAESSHGDILFFTDADCLVQTETLNVIRQTMAVNSPNVIVGGTYTTRPGDNRFFSAFQSAFINFSETKHLKSPDYLASHALAIDATTFRQSEGFAQDFLPILEDVEFSHRLRRMGRQLIIEPRLLVQHIFNYSLLDSFRNALCKTKYWVAYSLNHRDLLSDSGTASHELKVNVVCFYVSILSLYMLLGLDVSAALFGLAMLTMVNLTVNRKLFWAFYDANGSLFTLRASLYYLLAYPLPVGAGAVAGITYFIRTKTKN
jgi:glycosyltransferase involved in cell wall biosynthesis